MIEDIPKLSFYTEKGYCFNPENLLDILICEHIDGINPKLRKDIINNFRIWIEDGVEDFEKRIGHQRFQNLIKAFEKESLKKDINTNIDRLNSISEDGKHYTLMEEYIKNERRNARINKPCKNTIRNNNHRIKKWNNLHRENN